MLYEVITILLAGRPLHEPVVQYGPFVMNTREEIEEAMRDYQSGTLTRYVITSYSIHYTKLYDQGLPYSKIGRSVRYKLDDVIRYLHNQAAKGGKRVLIGTRWLFRKSPEKLNDFYNANSYLTNNHFSIDLWLQPTTSKKIFANYGFRAASKRHRWSNTISATD